MAEEEGFTVRDRRGRGADAGAERPAETPTAPPRGATPRPAGAGPRPGAEAFAEEPDLAALFLLLANSAVLHLGEGGPGVPPDLAQAKFSIDLLRLLREKTAGNRSPDESQLLDAVIYDLEMRFVRATSSR
jgi:hypothetical protein